MSKTKNKNHSELEHLRGQNKQLKSENRQLKRQLKNLENRAHFYEEVIEDVTEDLNIDTCFECGKGNLQVLDLKHVKFIHCDLCGYKERQKADEEKD